MVRCDQQRYLKIKRHLIVTRTVCISDSTEGLRTQPSRPYRQHSPRIRGPGQKILRAPCSSPAFARAIEVECRSAGAGPDVAWGSQSTVRHRRTRTESDIGSRPAIRVDAYDRRFFDLITPAFLILPFGRLYKHRTRPIVVCDDHAALNGHDECCR